MAELLILFALVAFLYSTVGHGGASGYLAVMALLGYSAELARTDALILNLVVSAVAFIQYHKGGYFRSAVFFKLAGFSVPFALLGGFVKLNDNGYQFLLSLVLLLAAVGIAFKPAEKETTRPFPFITAALIGSCIGLISGMTGIGGGVLLSPLLLLAGWAKQKEAAALSAAFIFVNSCSGLAGRFLGGAALDPNIYWMALTALASALAGAWLGAHKYRPVALKWILAVVLITAAVKILIEKV